MSKRTLTKQARTLVDRFGNTSVAPAQEREHVRVSIQMPNGSVRDVVVLVAPGQIINQKKLRQRVIDGDYGGGVIIGEDS